MDDTKAKILIIEDDPDVAEMLNTYFRVQGYDVLVSNFGEDGLRAAGTYRPDLVILDIRLPDIDGFEIARRLRTDRKTNTMPIIFLTEKRDRSDRLHGLELGADDYVTKPFDVQELRLRVRNALRRANQDSLTNAVTGLPEGDLVVQRLNESVRKENWSMVLVSLQNLEAFRDAYGFVASDDVMRAVSLMIHNAMMDAGTPESFFGHLSPVDFIVLFEPGVSSGIADKIRTRLSQSLDYFYPLKDRDQVSTAQNRLVVQTSHLASGEKRLLSIDEVKSELNKRRK